MATTRGAADGAQTGYPTHAGGGDYYYQEVAAVKMDFGRRNNALSDTLLDAGLVGELLSELGCGAVKGDIGSDDRWPCPVHGGDGYNFGVALGGHTIPFRWRCFSRECQDDFSPNLLGLARGALNRLHGRGHNMHAVVRFLENFLRRHGAKARVREHGPRPRPEPVVRPQGASWGIDAVLSRLVVPSPYFLRRGYSPEVLRRFRVGEPREDDPGSDFHRRAVALVLDEDGRRVVGFTGRSLFEKCGSCGRWHDPSRGCPPKEYRKSARYAKWRHSDGLHVEHTLYGWWKARPAVRRTGVIVLVEGPGDVWRLSEAGVENAVALFGRKLHDPQQVLLEASGAGAAVLLLDSDEKGRSGAEDAGRRLSRSMKVYSPTLSYHDVGSMTVEQVREYIVPVVEQAGRRARGEQSSSPACPRTAGGPP